MSSSSSSYPYDSSESASAPASASGDGATLAVAAGARRELAGAEKERIAHKSGGRESFCCISRGYKYVITEPYTARVGGGEFGAPKTVTVPAGFLCDGSTGGPDIGDSWVFHDWLYANHAWDGGVECTREQADALMYRVLKQEGQGLYARGFKALASCDCLGLFGRAWESGGSKGREDFMMSRR